MLKKDAEEGCSLVVLIGIIRAIGISLFNILK
jgi:hypothetical protein